MLSVPSAVIGETLKMVQAVIYPSEELNCLSGGAKGGS